MGLLKGDIRSLDYSSCGVYIGIDTGYIGVSSRV